LTLELVHRGTISLMRMVELFTTGPAGVLGMDRRLATNELADVTIFSTDDEWTYNVKETASKSRNSPFDGRTFRGGPVATIVGGKIIWKREK
jgi:dihydroorotase